ncbi:MAG: hypothetical protein V9F04_16580 [Dermatophilaceae bacterium]
MGEADTIRKAVSKKVKEQLDKHKAKFRQGASTKATKARLPTTFGRTLNFLRDTGLTKPTPPTMRKLRAKPRGSKPPIPLSILPRCSPPKAATPRKFLD